jgi:ABC-type nitrate/sulfonate/bicarbonate transport system ATPase subunit
MVEHVLRGRAERPKILPALKTKEADRLLRAAKARELVEWAKTLVSSTQHSLMLDNYAVSAKLASFPIDQDVWELRRACLPNGERASEIKEENLLRITLTASFAELKSACGLSDADRKHIDSAPLRALRDVLGDAFVPLEEGMVHPLLTWRDNLVFASMTLGNRRQEALVERVVLEESIASDLGAVLEGSGLDAGVGRAGTRLSGGQRQLVALARTLLRRTPVVVLDEPTSALDPASRARVTSVLSRWKEGRIVIVVTHDPEVARACDEVRLLERGRLGATGPFAEIASQSPIFAKAAGAR